MSSRSMSDYEANPVAVMEALALGRKVVVADTSGLSELAAEGLATAVRCRRRPESSPECSLGWRRFPTRYPPACRRGTTVQTSSSGSTRRSFDPPRAPESLNPAQRQSSRDRAASRQAWGSVVVQHISHGLRAIVPGTILRVLSCRTIRPERGVR